MPEKAKLEKVVSIVGRSKAGKTTLLEGIVAELKGRGYRVATVKHGVHSFEMDKEGKDSWRLAQAGSDAVVISSPQKLAVIKRQDHDATIEEILGLIGDDFDIVLTEGFKRDRAPKIEVHRKGLEGGLICSPEELLAIVTDEPLQAGVLRFSPQDVEAIADIIEQRLIRR